MNSKLGTQACVKGEPDGISFGNAIPPSHAKGMCCHCCSSSVDGPSPDQYPCCGAESRTSDRKFFVHVSSFTLQISTFSCFIPCPLQGSRMAMRAPVPISASSLWSRYGTATASRLIVIVETSQGTYISWYSFQKMTAGHMFPSSKQRGVGCAEG